MFLCPGSLWFALLAAAHISGIYENLPVLCQSEIPGLCCIFLMNISTQLCLPTLHCASVRCLYSFGPFFLRVVFENVTISTLYFLDHYQDFFFLKLINNRNLFLAVHEAGNLWSGCQHGWVRVLFQVADFSLCHHVVEGSRIFNVVHSLLSWKFLSFKILMFSFQK